jgi:hypothetical protein
MPSGLASGTYGRLVLLGIGFVRTKYLEIIVNLLALFGDTL